MNTGADNRPMRIVKFFMLMTAFLLLLAVAGAGAALYGFWYFGRDLPDYAQLASYEPPVMTRVHAGDGRLIAEYAREKRLFVPIEAIPKRVKNAFLAAEDKNFYQHAGIDPLSIFRAAITNIRSYGTGRRPVGASTITQQVAKNFLLTNEVSLTRKAKEAILALRIERVLSKDRILELYLNQIYLGFGSYGVAAAALNYFNKSLDELTVAEAAFLGALPKAPNNYNPRRYYKRALARRNWVIDRMLDQGFILRSEAVLAKREPLTIRKRDIEEFVEADWYMEAVRRELNERFGERELYEGGLSVRTSMSSRLQDLAQKELRRGLLAYDRRHGWRGPVTRLPGLDGWARRLAAIDPPAGMLKDWRLAVVLSADATKAEFGLRDGSRGILNLAAVRWARKPLKNARVGPRIRRVDEVLTAGDVVMVAPKSGDEEGWDLVQIPEVNGGLVAMDPHTGRVLALVGGWDFRRSQFNRATQAMRQPGSAFKPFVYAAALDSGFTPSSLVLDAPFVIDQGPGQQKWKPANYSQKFYGPSTLRLGIEKSRNLMTVRLAQSIGMEKIADYAARFGVIDNLPLQLSMALGAGETTLLKLTAGYAMLVNGGRRITPSLIDRIQDRRGKTIFRHDIGRSCPGCAAAEWNGAQEPEIVDKRARVISAITAYQVVSMLEGVVRRGTGVRIRAVGKPLGGKTGTTNKSRDTWFIGFSPDLAVGVFVGFDTPRTLGRRETGSSVSVPIFRDFMKEALADVPAIPFRVPPGVLLVRVNAKTGLPARPGDKRVILEAFRPGTEPRGPSAVLDGSQYPAGGTAAQPAQASGGLY